MTRETTNASTAQVANFQKTLSSVRTTLAESIPKPVELVGWDNSANYNVSNVKHALKVSNIMQEITHVLLQLLDHNVHATNSMTRETTNASTAQMANFQETLSSIRTTLAESIPKIVITQTKFSWANNNVTLVNHALVDKHSTGLQGNVWHQDQPVIATSSMTREPTVASTAQ